MCDVFDDLDDLVQEPFALLPDCCPFDEDVLSEVALSITPLPAAETQASRGRSPTGTPSKRKLLDFEGTTTTRIGTNKRVRFWEVSKDQKEEALQDDSDHVIDVDDSRLAATQRAAHKQGRSTTLPWVYDANDEMRGAYCDKTWFPREELLALSTLSTATRSAPSTPPMR